jgi:hypothetical protein
LREKISHELCVHLSTRSVTSKLTDAGRFVKDSETRMNDSSSMPLEILDLAFVLFGSFLRVERAKVATLAGLRILLTRIKSILSGFQFSDHDELLADEV